MLFLNFVIFDKIMQKKQKGLILKKLIAYITSAYPDKNFTVDLILSMKEHGVDGIELGTPFSDPVADGPVIEKANVLVLEKGYKIADTLYITKQIASSVATYWMGYFNPFYHIGIERFIQSARDMKIKGFIIPDLPFEESLIYRKLFEKYNMPLIDFVAPTDDIERVKKLVKNSKEFIYLVAYSGITGKDKKENIAHIIENVKKFSQTPLYIGFGVDEKTAKQKSMGVDGVIVGSAFIRILISDLTNREKIDKICQLSKNIKEAINS
jgi:tryptophan synthase alpha chain